MTGVYYNAAAVIDADGNLPRQISQDPHPAGCGFWEKVLLQARRHPATRCSTPGTASSASTSATTAIFRKGGAALALKGAEICRSTPRRRSRASPNIYGNSSSPPRGRPTAYYIGAINRVGVEGPWNIGEFYGQSYFVNPRGQIERSASRDRDEIIIHDMDFDKVAKSATSGKSVAIAVRKPIAPLTAQTGQAAAAD